MASAGKPLKFFVRNLPWTVNSMKLRNHFSKFGEVLSVNVIFDKKTGLSRGYGFLTYKKVEEASEAHKVKHFLEGNHIYVEPVST